MCTTPSDARRRHRSSTRSLRAAAVSLKRSTENILEVALRQTGGEAAKAAALRALSQDKHNAAGTIRVLVRELDATTEHAVFLGSEVRLPCRMTRTHAYTTPSPDAPRGRSLSAQSFACSLSVRVRWEHGD